MAYSDPTYVIFDGDQDAWAYRFMKGWNASEHMSFAFNNAHDLDTMTSRAQSEEYVKRNLRARMERSSQVLVLIGEKTKNLYRFVRWEMELALDLGLPIIAANLNESRYQDDRCPPVIRDKCVVHIPFKMRAIEHALGNWPREYWGMSLAVRREGARFYYEQTYRQLGL
ncbi:TIR domain-containing protein [Mesorhizobium sp. M0320]|uniref:TIR domain-containing protein n=1 Tax=unclassified Mesorhizobium TaxID=325217 RepID=UPI003339DCB6